MDALQRRLMIREAESRFEAAQALRIAGDASDSAYLLDLLGFELLLKLLVFEHTGKPAPWHHRYAEVFELLPSAIRQQLLEMAGDRIGPSGLVGDHAAVLRRLGSNFVDMRYPFQMYSNCSEREYQKYGAEWVVNGAPDSDAKFLYHPEELFGLICAARQMVGC